MNLRNLLFVSAAVPFCTVSLSATTLAHTWVSGSGNDNNNCSYTAPCATFQVAVDNTTAGGMVTAKDAGDFGPVNIYQSVTIDGNNLGSITFNAISGTGIELEEEVNVTVQNLTINGLDSGAYGILVSSGGSLNVLNCKIMNNIYSGIFFSGAGNLTVSNSWIGSFFGTNNMTGISISSDAVENVVVRDTIIDVSPIPNSNIGFRVQPGTGPVNASLQNVTIKGGGYEAVLAGSGVTQITGSVLTQNFYGVLANDGATVSIASSLITSNSIGVCSSDTGSKIRLDNNDIYDNTTAIANCGGIVKTSTTNKTSGTIAIPASDVSDSVTF